MASKVRLTAPNERSWSPIPRHAPLGSVFPPPDRVAIGVKQFGAGSCWREGVEPSMEGLLRLLEDKRGQG